MMIASAPRGTGPPVAIDVAVPDLHRPHRRGAASDDFVVEQQASRRHLTRGDEIGGTHRKTIDIGTVERRHVDACHNILRQGMAKRIDQQSRFAQGGARKQRGFKARQRILAGEDGQELLLLHMIAVGGDWRIRHRGNAHGQPWIIQSRNI